MKHVQSDAGNLQARPCAFSLDCVVVRLCDAICRAITISFIAVGSFVTLNEVARALEEPFGHSSNQLPVADLR